MAKEGKEFLLKTDKQLLRFECCNCGLTHDFEFKIINKEKIGIIIKREHFDKV